MGRINLTECIAATFSFAVRSNQHANCIPYPIPILAQYRVVRKWVEQHAEMCKVKRQVCH